MDSGDPRQMLLRQGYSVVRGVLNQEEVTALRELCRRELDKAHADTIFGKAFLGVPQLATIPFSQPVVSALKAVLGNNFVIVPEFTMQTGRSGTWHFDASSFRDASWLQDPDYLQVQCAIYLQDAHPVYAGGLGVIPKSHRVPFASWGFGSLPARLMRRLYIHLGTQQAVPTQAGDLLFFDFRLLHRGLPARVVAVPDAFSKYAIFFGAAATEKHAHLYMQSMKERGERGDPFYQDCAHLRFPDSYPQELIERCREARIAVASL